MIPSKELPFDEWHLDWLNRLQDAFESLVAGDKDQVARLRTLHERQTAPIKKRLAARDAKQ
jgi:hypothetical protein